MKSLERFMADGAAAQRAVDTFLNGQLQIGDGKPKRARTLNPTCFLNASACREFLLEHMGATRAHRFTRVSAETLHQLNESLRQLMVAHARRLPSKGKTI